MFERFTDEARDVVTGAQVEARQLKHRHIGTEHILLSLLANGGTGIAQAVLRDAGVYPQRVRADVQAALSRSPDLLGPADAEALRAIGIDLDAVRSKIEESFGEGALEPPADRPTRRRGLFRGRATAGGESPWHIPFSPRAKKVLELSLREALRLKHNYIGAEHILLGLLREGNGLAAKVLTDAGISLDDLRRHVTDALNRAA
jgi:ATP-dependent Clp protease ATP-binding subunit ClpA